MLAWANGGRRFRRGRCESREQHLWWQVTFYLNLHSSVQTRASVESNFFTSQMTHEQTGWPAAGMVTWMRQRRYRLGCTLIYKHFSQLASRCWVMVLKSKHLTYINVVRNTKKNFFFFFFCRAPFFFPSQFGLFQQSATRGRTTAAGPTEECSALPSFVHHLYMPEISNLISKIFLLSETSTMSLINLMFFFFFFFVNYFSGFRHICKQRH